MKRSILTSSIVFSILLTAGCVQESSATEDSNIEIHQQEGTHEGKKTSGHYDSIADYNEEITGEHLKTGVLDISRQDNKLHFKMKVSISPELQEKMSNTEEAFYFNITDFEGKHNLSNILSEPPIFTKANLDNIKDGKYYVIEQSVKIEDEVTDENVQEALLPENYELQLLTENKQIVAVIMGLELDMIN